MFSVLLSEKIGSLDIGIAEDKKLSPWQMLLHQAFTEVRLEGDKIDSNWKSYLGLKSISGPKDKNSLLQDLLMIIRGDKALFKPILEAGKNHNEGHKKRSMALFITKQLFSSQSSMRFLKR